LRTLADRSTDRAKSAIDLRVWTDLTRLARPRYVDQPGYVAGVASMLALVAWQSGNGALANVALDRALADDPAYYLADAELATAEYLRMDHCFLATPAKAGTGVEGNGLGSGRHS
jgi:hypothetical protein